MSEKLDDKNAWGSVTIGLPPELKGYEADFKRCWDGMVFKMRRNIGKGKWESVPLENAIRGLDEEVQELKDAIKHGNTLELWTESSDVCNMALIVAAIGFEHAGV